MSKTRFSSRVSRHIDAVLESQDLKDASSLSNPGLSIPDIIPQERGETGVGDGLEEHEEGREVELKKLVEEAEEKWESGRTERIVKEYEILDRDGERMKLSGKRGKGRDVRGLGDGVSNSDTGSNEDDIGEGSSISSLSSSPPLSLSLSSPSSSSSSSSSALRATATTSCLRKAARFAQTDRIREINREAS
ncbi:hypothetical protein M430DRAFT_35000 [Amorphotheca resinae ATCC 22711]|uniref:Uncharacterized protein n=1 Tax=Amorphotheca resinae ATCC 22711 TaxID=857342 RepID=A0A2T3B1P0_AMORE|nr:hypothetical protein M430DRAFT_35000 [Amorphotheca resinae ATCC 22711]PSS18475.1 hypothetical protein M430DRAFT_35000 [Amorphotheca resinae ATCC 22711]